MPAIQDIIKVEISNFLEPFKEKYKKEKFDFEFNDWQMVDNKYYVEVKGYYQNEYKIDELTPFVLLRLYIYHEWKQIQITNIFLPQFMRKNGIGKEIIKKIFNIGKQRDYTLFIVDMVQSFYYRMIKRGAIPAKEVEDAVQIVSNTDLSNKYLQ